MGGGCNATQVGRLSPFEPPPFDSRKLMVKFLDGSGATAPPPTLERRCYTLTHNDLTGQLFLSVGSRFDDEQVRPRPAVERAKPTPGNFHLARGGDWAGGHVYTHSIVPHPWGATSY